MWFNKRNDPGLDEAKRIAKARDGHQCKMPGCTEKKKLQMHHIRSYAKNIFLRADPNNLITLCKTHHKQVTGKEEIYAPMLLSLLNMPR
jgi:5-methylcytosine-specific restriction endonuclease McrA